MNIREAKQDDAVWAQVASLLSEAVDWSNDPEDDGNYRFVVASDENGELLGASVIDIGTLFFGPLSEVPAAFLENIEVLEGHRGKGVGAALLRATLDLAWRSGCESVRGVVDYDNQAALALYRSQGLGLIPEEDPDAAKPEQCYSIIAINPERVKKGYGRRGAG